MTSTQPPLLKVENLSVSYGHIEAVSNLSFTLKKGEITALVGANGAGKSTTLLALSGLLPKKQGHVEFLGETITNTPSHQIVRKGMVQVAEGRAILTTLTVHENLLLGGYSRASKRSLRSDIEEVLVLFPRLKERLYALAGNLSGGEQQMLAIGRALIAQPQLLLLDEPSMGLAPIIVQDIFRILTTIQQKGISIFLVEQNVKQALKIAQYAYVLENGRLQLEGTGAEVYHHPKVLEAYLGG